MDESSKARIYQILADDCDVRAMRHEGPHREWLEGRADAFRFASYVELGQIDPDIWKRVNADLLAQTPKETDGD